MRPVAFADAFLAESITILSDLDRNAIEECATGLAAVRGRGGRLFILGVGGSAGHASHAVNDFRKICGFEAYAPTDNVSELTARANDEGWDTTFSEWLRGSRLGAEDAVLVFSVGGGDREANVSANLVRPSSWPRSGAQRSSASSVATAATPPRWPTPASIIPPAVPRPHHAAHRRACAPWSGTCWCPTPRWPDSADEVGVACGDRRGRRQSAAGRAVVGGAGFIGSHFVDRLLGDPTTERGHGLRQLLLRARVAPRTASRTTPGCRSSRATSVTSTRLTEAMSRHRHGHPPRVEPRHRAALPPNPAIDFDQGTRADPPRGRGDAPRRRCRSDPLRLGQRRLRRPRRARGGRGPRAAGSGLDLRRQQAGRRGADRVLLLHVRPDRLRLPLRQRRRPAPDPRRRLRLRPPPARRPDRSCAILGDGTQSKSYIHVERRRSTPCCSPPRRPTALRRVQRRDRGLHHRHARSPSWPWTSSGCEPGSRRLRTTPAATAAGRATSRSSGSTPIGSGPWAGATRWQHERRRCAIARWPCWTTPRRAGCGDGASGDPAGGLPRPGRRPQPGGGASTGGPAPPMRAGRIRLLPGVAEPADASRRPGSAGGGHQPARHRPRDQLRPAELDAMHDELARGSSPVDDIRSAPTTTPTAATAASRTRDARRPRAQDHALDLAAASWWAIGGGTSKRAAGPGCRTVHRWITAMARAPARGADADVTDLPEASRTGSSP